jgi:hypothetical protein
VEQTPPYSHNLIRLAELRGIDKALNEKQNECILFLNAYYIKTRYLEDLTALSRQLNKKRSAIYSTP